jgi:type IV secretion system protein VirB9
MASLFCAPSFAQDTSLGLVNRVVLDDRQPPPANYKTVTPPQAKQYPPLSRPDYISRKPVNLNDKEKTALKLSNEWKARPINPVMVKNGQILYVFGATMPSIICSPFMPSDVELQIGETVNDVVVADTARWMVNIGRSGQPGYESTHLIIKPIDAGLETGAVIMTNRRTYHLKLVSKRKDFTPYVGFIYPEDQKATLAAQLKQQKRQKKWQTMPVEKGSVDLSRLDFGYRITGEASWKPVQVYNDGTRTVIRLPESASKGELPVLLVEKAGEQTLVNYRVRGNGFIVDEPFQKCILIAGVGDNQEKVEIERLVEQ